MQNKEYILVIATDSYAGNFERELTAHLTGHIGECGVGEEFVDESIEEKFDEYITGKVDEHGCWRPCAITNINDDEYKSLEIYLSKPLPTELSNIIIERAGNFNVNQARKFGHVKPIKILSIKQLQVTTVVNTAILNIIK